MDTTDYIQSDQHSSRTSTPLPIQTNEFDLPYTTTTSPLSPTEPIPNITNNISNISINNNNKSINERIDQDSKSITIINDLFKNPNKILSLNSAALNLLVRTFFCKVGEIEGFCNK